MTLPPSRPVACDFSHRHGAGSGDQRGTLPAFAAAESDGRSEAAGPGGRAGGRVFIAWARHYTQDGKEPCKEFYF